MSLVVVVMECFVYVFALCVRLWQRSVFRTLLMFGFHFLVWFLCVRRVRDTQCGFKLFSRPAAQLLFYNQHVERWSVRLHTVSDGQKLSLKKFTFS